MPKHVLGVALDVDRMTLVRLTGHARAYEVTLAVQRELPQHPDPEEQAALQRQAVHELVDPLWLSGMRGDAVFATLPAQHAVLRNLSFPFKDPRRIRQTLKFALDEHMPFEPEDVVVDFVPCPNAASAEMHQTRVLVAGMPEEVLASSLAFLQEFGFEPSVLDLDVFGLANAAVLGSKTLRPYTICVDVTSGRTLLTFLQHGIPVFVRSLAYGPEREDEAAIASYVGRFSKHLQHTFYACESMLGRAYEPEAILLSGVGDGTLTLLAPALQKSVDIMTESWKLTTGAYKPGTTALALPDAARYAVAFGVALRGLNRQLGGLNLRREHFALHRDLQELRGRMVVLGLLLILVAGLGVGSLYLNVHQKTQQETRLKEEIGRIFRAALPDTRMVQPTVQLREKIRELDSRLQAFGGLTGAQLSGLQILQEISDRIPPSIALNVDNLTIAGTEAIDFSGSTASYDDVVKLKSALETSKFLTGVKINNTKQDVDNKVAFKLTINTVKTLENTP